MIDERLPKTIFISAKCASCFFMSVNDENNQYIASYDGNVPSFIPNAGGDYIQMEINIESGRILNWKNSKGDKKFNEILKDAEKKVPAIISISAKCPSSFYMNVKDENNQFIAEYSCDVPNFMPVPCSDYLKMDINIEAGRILNWTNPIGHSKFTAILNGLKSD